MSVALTLGLGTVGQRIDHVVLDRDGVLNRELDHGPVTDPSQWEWEHGAVDGLRLLSREGVLLSVVTNQSCIGRGSVDRSSVDALHRWMVAELETFGVEMAGVHICPHAPEDGCGCRKPAPGLLLDALTAVGVPPASTLLVGDDVRDVQAGRSADTAVALVRTGKGCRSTAVLPEVPVFDDLSVLADHLIVCRSVDTSGRREAM